MEEIVRMKTSSLSTRWRALRKGIAGLAVLATAFGAHEGLAQDTLPLGLPPVPIPSDNSQGPEKIALGKALFMDKRLSADGTVSCATCHNPERAFNDGLPTAAGLRRQQGTRNTPTVANAAYNMSQFWDGRRPSLEEQAKDPFVNSIEHGLDNPEQLLSVIRQNADYVVAFGRVFGVSSDAITISHVSKAIASFERTLVSGNSAFDRYLYGGNKSSLSEAAIRGLEVFRGRGRCVTCHTIEQTSALFTDNQFHSLGVGYKRIETNLAKITVRFALAKGKSLDESVTSKQELSELGRFAVTLKPEDIGRFKTPSLRNVAVTAPYMHDGSVKTLEEAVDLEVYYRGIQANRPLILTPREKGDLVAFLRSLTSLEYATLKEDISSTR